MIKDYYDYLTSPVWQAKRSERLKIDQYKCQNCGSPFRLQVHHLRYPVVLGTENIYTDLITLCDNCHSMVEQGKKEVKQRWDEEKREREQLLQRRAELMKMFIQIHGKDDYSNVGIGKKDYCNLDVLKADYNLFMYVHGIDEPGSIQQLQFYFRNRRYERIIDMLEHGYPPEEIRKRTLFSNKMVKKVSLNIEGAKAALEKEKESFIYD